MGYLTGRTKAIKGVFCAFLLMILPALSIGMVLQEGEGQVVDAARRTDKLLESILRSAPAGIGMVEHRFITEVNDYILDLTGYSREELIGQNARMLYPSEEDYDFVGREKYRQIRKKGTGSVETRWLRKDGEIRHVILSSTPLDLEDLGAGVTFTVLDITDRKMAETRLRKSEERFRMRFEGASAIMMLIDPETGRVVDVNPAALAFYGWPRKTLTAMRIQDINTLSSEEVKVEMQKAFASARNYFEFRHRRADGSIRDVAVFSSAVDVGSKKLLFSIIHDISERKAMEASLLSRTRWFLFGLSLFIVVLLSLTAGLVVSLRRQRQVRQALEENEASLKRQNAVLNALLINLSSGVFMVEAPGGKPIIANPMAEKLLGVGVLPEASRDNLSEVYKARKAGSGGPYPVEEMPIIRAMKGESASIDDMIVERPDGSEVWLEIFGVPIRNEGGEVWAGLVHFQDITARKKAEVEREKLQNQLFQAQKMESVGVLAGGVAHDFNNLIQVMRGNLELLSMETSLDVRSIKRLHVVTGAMDRAAKLVQQLLLFSRKVESGRMRVNLNQAIREVSRLLERTIPKMIAMELHLASDLGAVWADPVQMEQTLLNLANNAADAMPEGGRLIFETENVLLGEDFVRTHPELGAGFHVLLTVSDTGSGMDAATLKQAFDPFFTTKEVGKGTGLGLASVYGIVKAHGGHVLCYSEPGHGSTFRIYLPVLDQEVVQEKKQPDGDCSEKGYETILFVEDERHLRDLGQEAMEAFGYTVLTAGSGEEALDLYAEKGPEIDLVLLDLNMPGMGGQRCLLALLEKNPRVKVLVSSGYSANGQAAEVLASGAKGFIGKPWQLKDLKQKIRQVLG
ncbi:PAS domain S-box-containing protein [Desulfobotulus alkaliphilus]|uniref:histidine kinase n=2 Tax=Desulfobotulus alkaliphilus TaxID=622671 RepID=A0A562RZ63_9BACT|nr:PAS domain S-box-containing protein [Desulfobotulus alkaliphilus]